MEDETKQPHEPWVHATYEARFALFDNQYAGKLDHAILLNVKVLEATQTIGGVTRDVKKEAQIVANNTGVVVQTKMEEEIKRARVNPDLARQVDTKHVDPQMAASVKMTRELFDAYMQAGVHMGPCYMPGSVYISFDDLEQLQMGKLVEIKIKIISATSNIGGVEHDFTEDLQAEVNARWEERLMQVNRLFH